MNVVFVSNFFNHHQAPFAEAMNRIPGLSFRFVETGSMPEIRRQMGYTPAAYPSYVLRREQAELAIDKAQDLIDNADLVLFGSAPERLLQARRKGGRLIFRYSERLYKRPLPLWKYVPLLIRNAFRYNLHRGEYLLCASAFTAYDFALTGNFLGKAYKWGYFPETRTYDAEQLMARKKPGCILWAGRLIDWKHPEAPILLAEALRAQGRDFSVDIIGPGPMQPALAAMIERKGLADCVHLLGPLPPEKVRERMERAEIYLFSSDRNEGWGAVLNEAMNSGCAVVASHAIGAVPFLVKNGENGLVYPSGDLASACDAVKRLLSDSEYRRRIGIRAYHTIADCWNAETAAERFVLFAQEIQAKGRCDLFEDGPCSRAKRIRDQWYGS